MWHDEQNKDTLLHYPKDKEEALKLIEEGMDVNVKNKDGMTPLHTAAINGKGEVVELLIQHGAIVNAVDNVKNTPLHYALNQENDTVSDEKYLRTIKTLHENGADIEASNKKGNTPLLVATKHLEASEEHIKFLLENGANPNAVNQEGNTALHKVVSLSSKFLEKDTSLVIKMLISNGAIVDLLNKNGETPLDVAIAHKNEHEVLILLANGFDINKLTTKDKGTTWHYLASKHYENLKLLQPFFSKITADINSVDYIGKTALDILEENEGDVSHLKDHGGHTSFEIKHPLKAWFKSNLRKVILLLFVFIASFYYFLESTSSIESSLVLVFEVFAWIEIAFLVVVPFSVLGAFGADMEDLIRKGIVSRKNYKIDKKPKITILSIKQLKQFWFVGLVAVSLYYLGSYITFSAFLLALLITIVYSPKTLYNVKLEYYLKWKYASKLSVDDLWNLKEKLDAYNINLT